jgi:threonine/homoserine/homoserine lactone efflux protein
MHLGAFLGVAVLVIVTPGPDTALTIGNALRAGRRGGVCTAAGVATGQATWALLTSFGVAAILRASQPAFAAIRLAGAAYLAFLGLRALVAAVRSRPSGEAAATTPRRAPGGATAYRQGLLSNLANPKMVVFFVSLLPQFGGTSFSALLALGLLFSAMTFAWLTGYAVVTARAGDLLARTRVKRALDATTGLVLVGLGIRLAADRHP